MLRKTQLAFCLQEQEAEKEKKKEKAKEDSTAEKSEKEKNEKSEEGAEKKNEVEPDFQLLENPARVMPAQVCEVSILHSCG